MTALKDHPIVQEFAATARAFLRFVAHPPKLGVARDTAALIARLYALGMQLPEEEPGNVDVVPDPQPTAVDQLRMALREHDLYSFAFDPWRRA